MKSSTQLQRIESSSIAGKIASQIFLLAGEHDSEADFLAQVAPRLLEASKGQYMALAAGEKGTWRILAESGQGRSLPSDLLAETLDCDRPQLKDSWLVAPLAPRSGNAELLAVFLSGGTSSDNAKLIDALAALLNATLEGVRRRQRQSRRVERLEVIIDIADKWNQTLEMDTLLGNMAEASTRLLRAERASIFLWDRLNNLLVGRPALGVEGGELRISDDEGIVGQVVQSGEPRRVDADITQEQTEINRRVDKKLGFETRSLLCVPLHGSSGELFGAFEMINKIDGNFTDDDEAALVELASHAAIALENTQQHEHLLKSLSQITDQAAKGVQLIGECPPIEALRSTVRRVADTELSVLILGPNGSGKEVISQMIHYLSKRRDEPFVAINCAALTESLLESELFGHEKGAFTDAQETRPGKFEIASGGTLFLDEIGDMSLSAQAKILRVLEEKVVVRVGGSTPIHTDARVLAATNQNLAEMVREKKFREDLFFRINVITLDLPPLRDRGDDILLLANHFLRDFCGKARRKPPKFTAAARKRLLAHSWPGNVRELRNLMERLAYMSPEDRIDADELAFILAPEEAGPAILSLDLPLTEATQRFQIEYIRKHVEAVRGNVSDAASRLGMHRSNLYRKMRLLGIEVDE